MNARRARILALGAASLWLGGAGFAGAEPAAALDGEPERLVSAPVERAVDPIERAWFARADSLGTRVDRTRRIALQQGVWNLDSAARATLNGGVAGDPLQRAEAALRLAPDLPAARMALAEARWLHDGSPIGALRTAASALLAIPRHPEASLWFAGSALYLLAAALVAGGLLWIAVAASLVAFHAAHDFADPLARGLPASVRVALLSALVLAPAALGEGLLGVALVLLVLAVAYGGAGQRAAMTLAAAGLVLGAFPVARLAGAALVLPSTDPVLGAALAAERGGLLPFDLVRLEAARPDRLAARALAVHARRQGRLAEADAGYQALLEAQPEDAALANNAANVRLALGHMDRALALYRRSAQLHESPVVLFNLSQAHGRAFQVDDLGRTLARAQKLDGDVVAELTHLQGTEPEGFVVDLPLTRGQLWPRVIRSDAGEPIAAAFRAGFAPGRLGRSRDAAGAALCIAVLSGLILPALLRPSHCCRRCGRRLCLRCEPGLRDGDVCESCTRLFQQPQATDRALRLERVTALRERERRLERAASLASMLVPGAAGLLARRPLAGLFGTLLFAVAVAAAVWHRGVVPDPLVAGGAAPLAFLSLAALSTLAYAVLVAICMAMRRRG